MIAPSISPRKPQKFSAALFGKVAPNATHTEPGHTSVAFRAPPPQHENLALSLRQPCQVKQPPPCITGIATTRETTTTSYSGGLSRSTRPTAASTGLTQTFGESIGTTTADEGRRLGRVGR